MRFNRRFEFLAEVLQKHTASASVIKIITGGDLQGAEELALIVFFILIQSVKHEILLNLHLIDVVFLMVLLHPLQAARILCHLYLLLQGEVIVELPSHFLFRWKLHKKKLQEVNQAVLTVDEPGGDTIIALLVGLLFLATF